MADASPVLDELRHTAIELLNALDGIDFTAIDRLLVPDSPAATAVQLFDLDALAALIGAHLPSTEFMSEQALMGEREADLQLARHVEAAVPWWLRFTLAMRRYRNRWRIWSALPVPLNKTIYDDLELDETLIALLEGSAQLTLRPDAARDEVERLFLPGMHDRGLPFLDQVNAARIWRDFVKKAKPALARPQPWAAAVEYTELLMEFRKGSQGEIGSAYGVSAATVAARYKEIVAALGLYQNDDRYSLTPMSRNVSVRASLALGVPVRDLRMPLGGGRGKSFFG